jgi:imidazolonepropionase-like amidohydrolase
MRISTTYSRSPAKIAAAGGKVGVGGHGYVIGLSPHWEMWLYVKGGMPAHDALRAGTIWSAQEIGHGDDLGSLEVGKLADLQILDKNPLTDIHNTLPIRYVMKNGRLYDASDLTEIWRGTSRSNRFGGGGIRCGPRRGRR